MQSTCLPDAGRQLKASFEHDDISGENLNMRIQVDLSIENLGLGPFRWKPVYEIF